MWSVATGSTIRVRRSCRVSIAGISVTAPNPTGKEWHNAAWIGKQMVYGQKKAGRALRSYAAALDVVAHEICHGLTDRTARLQYQGMTGAMNESLSDIFGIIISNFDQPHIKKWNWQMGEDLTESGVPLRDLSDPPKFRQPDHMNDFVQTTADFGGVHTNSGIHNKAAFNILTTPAPGGGMLFDAQTVIQLFYLTLTQHLSRTSGFQDSRRGMDLSARSLLRNDADRRSEDCRHRRSIRCRRHSPGVMPTGGPKAGQISQRMHIVEQRMHIVELMRVAAANHDLGWLSHPSA